MSEIILSPFAPFGSVHFIFDNTPLISCISLSFQAHVVAVFEQSLTGMTSRLQQLTSCTEQKDSELQDLREKIEQLKIAHTEGRNGSLRSNGTDLLRKHSIGSKDQICKWIERLLSDVDNFN